MGPIPSNALDPRHDRLLRDVGLCRVAMAQGIVSSSRVMDDWTGSVHRNRGEYAGLAVRPSGYYRAGGGDPLAHDMARLDYRRDIPGPVVGLFQPWRCG